MRKARTFIVVLLALAMVFVPMAASMAAPASAKMTMTASADCDHQFGGHALPQKVPSADDHCLAMANCALCFITLTAVDRNAPMHELGMDTPIDSRHPSGPSLSWQAAPPLRPPRV